MGLGCLVEAGLFGDNILHRRSPDLQTFSPLFVVYRNPLLSGLFRFARGSCQQDFRLPNGRQFGGVRRPCKRGLRSVTEIHDSHHNSES
jgi:hypothetical protein